MKCLGGLLFLYGLLSIIYSFMDRNLKILVWIDMWGDTVGWAIRIGLVVLGGLLWLVGNKAESA